MRTLRAILALACIGAMLHGGAFASEAAPEYAIKAVFLFNLVKYAEWPRESPLSDPAKPIVLAVIGEDPFGSTLDEAVRDRTVRGRPVLVVRAKDAKNVGSAHVAFLSLPDPGHAGPAVHTLADRATITVGDTTVTARAGAVVNFVVVQGKLRFDVNQASARRCRVEFGSQFLKLARHIVEGGD